MTYQGIDTAARISAEAAQILRDNGISFVGRYLVPESLSKALTAKEATKIRDAGLAIILCWELETNAIRQGQQRGTQDGQRAKQCAEELGVPAGTCIYFACDYNIPYGDLQPAERYLKAAQTALGGKYVAGIYGPQKLMSYLSDRNVCRHLWQCCAWSDFYHDSVAVRQYEWQGGVNAKALASKVGFDVDLDDCADMTAAGLWMPEASKPWYADAMEWGEATGIMKDGRPNDTLTRAEAITMLMRYHRTFTEEDNKTFSGLLNE